MRLFRRQLLIFAIDNLTEQPDFNIKKNGFKLIFFKRATIPIVCIGFVKVLKGSYFLYVYMYICLCYASTSRSNPLLLTYYS